MAMKWVAQMPKPVDMAEAPSQTIHIFAPERGTCRRTWCSRLMVVYELSAQMATARATSRKSCWVATQSKTLYMQAPQIGGQYSTREACARNAEGSINKTSAGDASPQCRLKSASRTPAELMQNGDA